VTTDDKGSDGGDPTSKPPRTLDKGAKETGTPPRSALSRGAAIALVNPAPSQERAAESEPTSHGGEQHESDTSVRSGPAQGSKGYQRT